MKKYLRPTKKNKTQLSQDGDIGKEMHIRSAHKIFAQTDIETKNAFLITKKRRKLLDLNLINHEKNI